MVTLPGDIGARLSALQENAGLTQAGIAPKIQVDQSKISRLEKGEFAPSFTEVQTYLEVVDTEAAHRLLQFLQKEWNILPSPSLDVPELDAIWLAEQTLVLLGSFEQERDPPGPVQAEIEMHRQSLQDAANFLSRLDHQIGFIGEIGVGKTTAVCLAANLLLSEPGGTLPNRVALETGSGRITICEVQIKAGPGWGLIVIPYDESEIYRLVGDLCESAIAKSSGEDSETDAIGVPQEIERALRNMSSLGRTRTLDSEGKRIAHDPLRDLAKDIASLDELRSEISSRLQLWQRSTREIWWAEDDKRSPLEWMREQFTKVNNGRLENVSLPQRIDVIVPRSAIDQNTFDISFIDTRGVDGTAIRPDLKACLDDERMVTVLCSRFMAAPDSNMQGFIEHALDTGSVRALSERVVLLVLPRPGEASEMKDDSGQVETDAEGYQVKGEQVSTKLGELGVDELPVLFFNSASDSPNVLHEGLLALVGRMRLAHAKRIDSLASIVDNLINNYELEAAALVHQKVTDTLRIFAQQHQSLPERLQPVHYRLITALQSVHPRTVWATTRRKGSWYNLDVFYYLGTGAASEARRRSNSKFHGLKELLNNMLGNPDLESAHGFLEEVLLNSDQWSERFIQTARQAGEHTFRLDLQDDNELWNDCENRWGGGPPYRADIAKMVEKWFLDDQRASLHLGLERRVSAAWETEVLRPLLLLCDGGVNTD